MVRDHKGSTIQLVITDIIMPLMGGDVMAEWLKIAHPNIKVLFSSGYADDAITNRMIIDQGFAFLPKPYAAAMLVRKVRGILDNVTDTALFKKQSERVTQNRTEAVELGIA